AKLPACTPGRSLSVSSNPRSSNARRSRPSPFSSDPSASFGSGIAVVSTWIKSTREHRQRRPMQNGAMAEAQHPWSRYVALGDSFTEGIGDPEPRSPGGHRGWADRVAEVPSSQTDDFAYANLAVRGKLIKQILDEQVDAAVALRPDLITISAGGNDVIRPGTDPDAIAQLFDEAVSRLSVNGATIVVFTGVDVGFSP